MEMYTADVELRYKPKSGKEAYRMLVSSLAREITEKQIVLSELTDEEVKKYFIANYNENTKCVNIFTE